MNNKKLPNDLEEITPAWMEAALQAQFPGVRVSSLKTLKLVQGTSTKAQLSIEYANQNAFPDLPETLWIKGNFAPDRQMMAELGIYLDEVRFYRDLQPHLTAINTPRCFYADADDTGQGILLLEDLLQRNVRFGRGPEPLERASAEQLVEMLAVLHARWWQSPTLDTEFSWASDPLPDGAAGIYFRAMSQQDVWSQRCSQVHALGLPRRLLDLDTILPAMHRLQKIDRSEPRCLLHGDMHFGNLFVEENGRPGLFDWQCLRRGHWAHDVNYSLVSALDIEDRRAWEQDLLRHYLQALQKQLVLLNNKSVVPTFDEAWLSYRQQNLYGLFFWITNNDTQQPQENNIAITLRYAMATLDHQTLQLLA